MPSNKVATAELAAVEGATSQCVNLISVDGVTSQSVKSFFFVKHRMAPIEMQMQNGNVPNLLLIVALLIVARSCICHYKLFESRRLLERNTPKKRCLGKLTVFS